MIDDKDIFFDLTTAPPPASAELTAPARTRTPEQVATSAARMRAKVVQALGPYGIARPPKAHTESELFAAHEAAVFEAADAAAQARRSRLLAWRMGRALDA